jgi:predicted CXXCH cytochrome family protein
MKLSNRLLSGLLGLGAVLFIALPLSSQAAIKDTKHNLSSSGTQASKVSTETEICVFCHTPHGADATAPLWNKALPAAGGFTPYTSSTMDDTTMSLGGISLACLSCHDGVSAMDSMINAPGSGAGAGSAASQGYTWSGTGSVGTNLAARQMNTGIANLGIDLSNDHPVGISYAGGTDPDFNAATTVSGKTFIDTNSDGARQKTDLVIYSGQVECATCHDPHSGNATFLRIPNTGSAVCLACHIK